MSNLPTFDPLNPTPQEEADMLQGYQDGYSGRPIPDMSSLAYDHGRRNAVNDKARTADPEQIELARRLRALSTSLMAGRAGHV